MITLLHVGSLLLRLDKHHYLAKLIYSNKNELAKLIYSNKNELKINN